MNENKEVFIYNLLSQNFNSHVIHLKEVLSISGENEYSKTLLRELLKKRKWLAELLILIDPENKEVHLQSEQNDLDRFVDEYDKLVKTYNKLKNK